jgi:hypothetical protein
MTESKKGTCMAQSDPNAASIPSDSSVVQAETRAKMVLRPGIQGAFTIKDYTEEFGEIDPAALANQLVGQTEEVNKGELKHAEAILAVCRRRRWTRSLMAWRGGPPLMQANTWRHARPICGLL